MNKIDNLEEKLKNNGFHLMKSEKSGYFGDYIIDWVSDTIVVRISSDRSFESIDICRINDNNENFDLVLIKAMLQSEQDFNKEEDIESLVDFFVEHFDKIIQIFNEDQYTETKKQLEALQKRRVSQMFPNWNLK